MTAWACRANWIRECGSAHIVSLERNKRGRSGAIGLEGVGFKGQVSADDGQEAKDCVEEHGRSVDDARPMFFLRRVDSTRMEGDLSRAGCPGLGFAAAAAAAAMRPVSCNQKQKKKLISGNPEIPGNPGYPYPISAI